MWDAVRAPERVRERGRSCRSRGTPRAVPGARSSSSTPRRCSARSATAGPRCARSRPGAASRTPACCTTSRRRSRCSRPCSSTATPTTSPGWPAPARTRWTRCDAWSSSRPGTRRGGASSSSSRWSPPRRRPAVRGVPDGHAAGVRTCAGRRCAAGGRRPGPRRPPARGRHGRPAAAVAARRRRDGHGGGRAGPPAGPARRTALSAAPQPGSATVNVAPVPGPPLAAVRVPPCASTMARAMVSPTPLWIPLPVRAGSAR